MKKFVLLLSACGLIASLVYAGTATRLRGASGEAGITVLQDTSWTAIVDTSFSDTVDISGISSLSKGVWMSYNVGTVDLCDSCNDSVIIIYCTYLRNGDSYSSKLVRTDTFAITSIAGSTAITSVDDAAEYRYIPADSLYGERLFVRTIIKDAITHAWTGATPAAALRTLTVPVVVDILYR